MRIAMIGAGNVGGTLGRRWAAAGHDVTFGSRRGADGGDVQGSDALSSNVRVAPLSESVRGADVVVLATPWDAARDALLAAGAASGAFDGVTLIDATNPIGRGLTLLAGEGGASGAEQLQALVPHAKVVKAFNTTGYENMRDPVYDGVPSVMFYAGDDAGAKRQAAQLATDLGFDAVDAGALIRARELEHLAILWISMAIGGMGRNIAFRLMRR